MVICVIGSALRVPFGAPILLFLLVINNMTQRIPPSYSPDDSKLTGNAQSSETIQSDWHCLSQWADARQMKFSELRYCVLHIGKVNPKFNYTMGNSPLQVLERKEIWEWLFQLVIPFAGNKICEE